MACIAGFCWYWRYLVGSTFFLSWNVYSFQHSLSCSCSKLRQLSLRHFSSFWVSFIGRVSITQTQSGLCLLVLLSSHLLSCGIRMRSNLVIDLTPKIKSEVNLEMWYASQECDLPPTTPFNQYRFRDWQLEPSAILRFMVGPSGWMPWLTTSSTTRSPIRSTMALVSTRARNCRSNRVTQTVEYPPSPVFYRLLQQKFLSSQAIVSFRLKACVSSGIGSQVPPASLSPSVVSRLASTLCDGNTLTFYIRNIWGL